MMYCEDGLDGLFLVGVLRVFETLEEVEEDRGNCTEEADLEYGFTKSRKEETTFLEEREKLNVNVPASYRRNG